MDDSRRATGDKHQRKVKIADDVGVIHKQGRSFLAVLIGDTWD